MTTYQENTRNIPTDNFLQGFKDCIPTLLGYISIGLAFGVVGVASNLSVLEISLFSIFIYAGSAQFIVCALLLTNSPISAITLVGADFQSAPSYYKDFQSAFSITNNRQSLPLSTTFWSVLSARRYIFASCTPTL